MLHFETNLKQCVFLSCNAKHFDLENDMPLKELKKAINARLDKEIRIIKVKKVKIFTKHEDKKKMLLKLKES